MPLEVKKKNSVKEHAAENDEEGEDNLSSFVKPKKKKPLKKDDKVDDNLIDENNLGCSNKEKKQQQMKKKKKKTSNKGEKEKKPKKILLLEEKKKKKAVVAGEANGKKKVFDLPGQKRDPPEERDPLRIFYETLYQQLPHSELAAIWMMEYGLLSREVAETVHERKQMKKNQLKLSSPTKVVATVKKTTKSVTVNKTKFSPDSTAKKTTKSVTVKKTLGCSSAGKKKSASKTELKQSKKRKMGNSISEDEPDDFVLTKTKKKKSKA